MVCVSGVARCASPWVQEIQARGFPRGVSTVTLFQGHGVEAFVDIAVDVDAGVEHQVAADLIAAVGKAVGKLVRGGHQQDFRPQPIGT